MATLFNTKIKDTYQSLLKLEDNTILTTTVKNVTDGLGNASPLYMSTTRVGIGTNAPTTTLDVNGSAKVSGAVSILNPNYMSLTSNYTLEVGYNVNGKIRIGYVPSVGSVIQGSGNGVVDYLSLQYFGGNVGIGTVADAGYKLDVNGTARLGVSGGYVTVTSYTPGATTMSVSNSGHHGATAIFASSAVGINAISVLGAGPSTALGVGVAARKAISPLVGTFTDADGVVNSTYKSIGLYAERAIISNSGSAFNMTNGTMLHVDGATIMSGSVTANSIPASPNTAYGLNIKNTLVAAANNDSLVALDINPTFTNGAFTGVNNYNIKTRGLLNKMYFQSPTTNQGRHDISFGFGGSGEQVKLIANAMGGSGEGDLYISLASGDTAVATTSNANALFQTGGTTFFKSFTLSQSALTSGNGLYLSGNQQNSITNGIYFRFSETRVAILSKPNGGSGYADFRIAIVPLGGGSTNNPPQLSDTKFMITQDTTNVLINTTTDSGYKLNVNGTAFVSELITTGGMVKLNPYTVGVRALEIYSGTGHGGNTGVWASMYQVGVYGNGWDSYYGTQGYGVIGDPNNTSNGGSVVNIGVYGGASLSNATGVRGTSGLFGKVTNFRNASAALEVNSTTHGFLPPRMTAAQRGALTTITGFGTITGGSGYVDGTYRTVSLTGGSGQNAYARITISGGSVTNVELESVNLGGLSGGFGYTNGASVSASNTQLGGSGAGFSVIINASTPVGMMVYQTDATEGLYIYKSTGWTFIA